MDRRLSRVGLAVLAIASAVGCQSQSPSSPATGQVKPGTPAGYQIQDFRPYFHKHFYPGTYQALYWVYHDGDWDFVRYAREWRYIQGWVYMYVGAAYGDWSWVWIPWRYRGWIYIVDSGWTWAGFNGGIPGGRPRLGEPGLPGGPGGTEGPGTIAPPSEQPAAPPMITEPRNRPLTPPGEERGRRRRPDEPPGRPATPSAMPGTAELEENE